MNGARIERAIIKGPSAANNLLILAPKRPNDPFAINEALAVPFNFSVFPSTTTSPVFIVLKKDLKPSFNPSFCAVASTEATPVPTIALFKLRVFSISDKVPVVAPTV